MNRWRKLKRSGSLNLCGQYSGCGKLSHEEKANNLMMKNMSHDNKRNPTYPVSKNQNAKIIQINTIPNMTTAKLIR